MQAFFVTVKTTSARYDYPAIAMSASDIYPGTYERFGACGVSVRPMLKE
ncbi:MAG TPA: hypothetical protein VM571_10155 [Noviherbaspirillum sp.]|nr:hypothetical protein [Noviherbaspirillum sp.]